MNKQRKLRLILVILVTLLLCAGPHLGKARSSNFFWQWNAQNKHLCGDFSGTRYAGLEQLEYGVVWTADVVTDGVTRRVTHIRNRFTKSSIELKLDDAVVSGTLFYLSNANWVSPADGPPDATSVDGPKWGTFWIVFGGCSKPSFKGFFYGDGDHYNNRWENWRAEGIGLFSGFEMTAYAVPVDDSIPPGRNDWSIEGEIIGPRCD